MKHLKLFNDVASYEAWKNSEEYVTPNVVFSEETRVIYTPYVAPVSPNLVLIFNVTDTSQETKVMHDYAGRAFTSMIVDGVETDFDYYYQFNTIGKHKVEFVFAEGYNNRIDEGWLRINRYNDVNVCVSAEFPATINEINVNSSFDLYFANELIFHSLIEPKTSIGTWNDETIFFLSETGVLKYPKGADYSNMIQYMATYHPGWVCVEF